MKKRRSAYEIPYSQVEMSEEERRRAIEWWQRGDHYHPLLCPVCGGTLALPSQGVALQCPTEWCSYTTGEIPWAVFAAYRREKGKSVS